jgi:hypothetical protein
MHAIEVWRLTIGALKKMNLITMEMTAEVGGRGVRGAKRQNFSDADNSLGGIMGRAFFNTAQFTNVTFAFVRGKP